MRAIFLAVFVFTTLGLRAQSHSVRLGLDLPLQYKLGYTFSYNRLSGDVNFGVLTTPFNNIILDILEGFNVDDEVVLIIENAYDFGVIPEARLKYHFGKFYTGITYQMVILTASDAPTDIIEIFLNEDLTNYQPRVTRPRNRAVPVENNLTLQANLHQLGVLAGYEFGNEGNKLKYFSEIAFLPNIASRSRLTSAYRDIGQLSNLLNDELEEIFSSYAHLATLNIGVRFIFN